MPNIKRKNETGSLPTDAAIAVTYKCNAKCVMCNIWKEESKTELKPKDFSKLPVSLKDLNITGGEPFLRTDIIEIIEEITNLNPKIRIVISSNGFLTDRIIDYMQKIRKINPKSCIAISLDGMDSMHDRIRGVNNAYDKAISTIKGLKKANINDIRIGFTASNENISHLSKIYDLSQFLGIEFTLSVVHNAESYFNIGTNQPPDIVDLENHLNYIIQKEYKFINPRRLYRIYYIKGILDFVKTNKRPLSCLALKDFFFMDPKGNVYPCNILDKPVGNIGEESFDSIWKSVKTEKLRNFCNSCNKCWMVCTVKSSIRKEFFRVTREIGKDIIPAKLGLACPLRYYCYETVCLNDEPLLTSSSSFIKFKL